MDPKLVEYLQLTYEEYDRIESDDDGRKEKDNHDVLCPAESEGDRPIVFLGVVMCHMGGPPESIDMCNIVRPV